MSEMISILRRVLHKVHTIDPLQIESILQSFQKSYSQIEAVLNALPSGIIVSDAKHHPVFTNSAAQAFLKTVLTRVEQSLVWEFFVDKDVATFVCNSLCCKDAISESVKEFRFGDSDHTRIISVTIFALSSEYSESNIILIEDKTEERQRELRVRRTENLASLTTLAAGVAHEIKNPLGSISIHVQLMEKALKKKKPPTEQLQRYFSVIDEEINRLNQVIMDFLFTVRPMNLSLLLQKLHPILEDVLLLLHYELKEADITIKRKIRSDLPKLYLDDRLIKQAILNIIQNAISALPQGGGISITINRQGEKVMLAITDTGEGIAEDIIDKVYEPFFTTREYGNGLGLTRVYKILKEHQGSVSIQSRKDEGTTVVLFFPIPDSERTLLDQPRSG